MMQGYGGDSKLQADGADAVGRRARAVVVGAEDEVERPLRLVHAQPRHLAPLAARQREELVEDAVRAAALVEGHRHRLALEVEDGVDRVDRARPPLGREVERVLLADGEVELRLERPRACPAAFWALAEPCRGLRAEEQATLEQLNECIF